MLTEKQQLTLEHLKNIGISENNQILEWCINKLKQPKRQQGLSRANRRRRGKNHYFAIIDHINSLKKTEHTTIRDRAGMSPSLENNRPVLPHSVV